MRLHVVEARGPGDFDKAFSDMTRAHAGALAVLGSAVFNSERRRLVDLMDRRASIKTPAATEWKAFLDSRTVHINNPRGEV